MQAAFSPDGSRIAYGSVSGDWRTMVLPILGGHPCCYSPTPPDSRGLTRITSCSARFAAAGTLWW